MIYDLTIKEEFKDKMRAALMEGLSIMKRKVDALEGESWAWLGRYHREYPTSTVLDSGMPRFSLSDLAKKDYTRLLIDDSLPSNIQSWRVYHEYVLSKEELRKHMVIGEFTSRIFTTSPPDLIESWNTVHTYSVLSNAMERYIHKYGFEFEENQFVSLFDLYFNSFVGTELPIDLVVPIILVHFDFDEFTVTDSVSIQRMSDELQLSRNIKTSYTSPSHDNVVGAATHAFVIKGYKIPNDNVWDRGKLLGQFDYYRNELVKIDQLFASLRTTRYGIETGYCQIVVCPDNWAGHFKVDLLDVTVVSDRMYPKHFEDYGWLNDLPSVSRDDVGRLKLIYNAIRGSTHFTLPVKRLNKAALNSRDDDAIIDISIALESLLTTDSRSEITYRLAARAALLTKLNPFRDYNAAAVFKLCKELYDFRSRTVHGSRKQSDKVTEINSIGIEFLEHIIFTLIQNPAITQAADIDKLFLE